jgi:exonuclease VII small subunit
MSEVALREHLEAMMREADRRYEQRFAASEEAVRKAERGMSVRLDSMNEFREALRDQANRMATRDELKNLSEVVQELQRAKANLDGRLVVLSAAVSLIVTITLWAVNWWR